MQQKFRFIGLRPFETDEKDLFFERETSVNEVFKSINFKKITTLHASAGIGKTSILKAGVIPLLEKKSKFKIFYLSVKNYMKKSAQNIFEQINEQIKDQMPTNSYLDKIIEPEETLWYKFKRIEAASDTTLVLILDQFENIFSYEETQISVLKRELHALIYEQIPVRLRDYISQKLDKNPDTLTALGLKKLYEKINIKIVFSIRTDKLQKLEYFEDKININENIIEIQPINSINAQNILLKTSSFKHKYNIDNNLTSKPFTICQNLIDKILQFLTKNNTQKIETYQLQIIGREIEKISYNKNKQNIYLSDLNNFEDIYRDYYETIVEKIENSEQQISARKLIEDELIFEYEKRKLTVYEGIIIQKYNLSEKTLKYLIDNHLIKIIKNKNNDVFYEISHDALITPILWAKNKRIKYEIQIQKELDQKKKFEEEAKIQKNKSLKNKRFALFFLLLFVIALTGGIIAKNQKNLALKNKIKAESTLYAYESLNIIETDPTKSLRLAQKAYSIDKYNVITIEAMLKSFHKTNIFYSIIDTISFNFNDAYLSNDCSKYLTINYLNNKSNINIFNKQGKITNINSVTQISSATFFHNNSKILISTRFDGKIYIFDTLGLKITEFSHGAYVNYATISADNSTIVTCGSDLKTKIWSTNGILLNEITNSAEVIYANFSYDKSLILTVDLENKITIFSFEGKIINSYMHELDYDFDASFLSRANFSPDNKKVVFCINNQAQNHFSVKILSLKENKITFQYNDFTGFINNINFIDSANIIGFSKNAEAKIININTNTCKNLTGHIDEIFDIKYETKNEEYITISKDKTIRKWKINSSDFNFDKYRNKTNVKYSNTSSYIAFLNNNLQVIDLLQKPILIIDTLVIQNVFFSSNDNYIISTTNNQFIISNISSKKSYNVKINEPVKLIYFSETNKKIHVISENSIKIFSDTGNLITNNNLNYKITSASMFYNQIFASTKNSILKLNTSGQIIDSISINNSTIVKTSKAKKIKIIAFANDILYLISQNFEITNQIKTNSKITCADISDNNNFFAYGNELGDCVIFNKDGKEIITFKQTGTILNVQFSSNEKRILILFRTKNLETKIKSYIISPIEINKFIDELKLYGDVQKFNLK
ncbi:MAG: hypothetical protein JXR68_05795 [Bacteroidales bacterium]|nr:hypothetical protein [Bacteroidales bacterium]